MIKSILTTLCLFSGLAVANPNIPSVYEVQKALVAQLQDATKKEAKALNLPWKVGETSNYALDLGILKGTLNMVIEREEERGFWLVQAIDLSVQKQRAELLIDRNTGEILEFIVDGQRQDIPEQGPQEIVEQKEDNITVPKGNFDVLYLKIKDDKDQISEVWINPSLIPISGMVQQISPGPMGLTITSQLTDFKKL